MTRFGRLVGLVVCGFLTWTGAARADAVVDWNDITSQAILAAAASRPGPSGILDFAVVHAAVYDAVQAIEGQFEPYAVEIPGATGSPDAAAARAAHDVLVNRFPFEAAAFLDPAYHAYLAGHGLAEDDPGVAVGQQAAAGIIALRANDGSFPAAFPPFTGGTDPGVWRPTPSYLAGPPPSLSPMAVPWLATVTPFTLRSQDQFQAPPPPDLSSKRYARDYNEIQARGADVNSTRTPEQTELALFWALNYVTQWNLALRGIALAHLDHIADSARLFALSNFAIADAAIASWDTKLRYVFWRPVTAIQEGDNDGNSRTIGDVNWRPLINTPNYPDYASGANAATGAVTRMLKLFFGKDHFTFVVTTNNALALQKERTYTRFSDAADDVLEARILEGIHFRTADVNGRKQGRHVARWVFHHVLRPVHGNAHDGEGDDEDDD